MLGMSHRYLSVTSTQSILLTICACSTNIAVAQVKLLGMNDVETGCVLRSRWCQTNSMNSSFPTPATFTTGNRSHATSMPGLSCVISSPPCSSTSEARESFHEGSRGHDPNCQSTRKNALTGMPFPTPKLGDHSASGWYTFWCMKGA